MITAVNELDPKEQYQLKLTEYSLPPWLSYFFKGLATFYKYLLEKEHTDFDDIELCLLVRIKVLH